VIETERQQNRRLTLRRNLFTFERKRVAFAVQSKRFGRFLDLLVGWRFRQFLTRRQRVVRNSRRCPADVFVDRPIVWAVADLFSVLGHRCLPFVD